LRPFSEDAEYIEESLKNEARTFKLSREGEHLKLDNFQTWYDLSDMREYYGPLLPERIERAIRPGDLPAQ